MIKIYYNSHSDASCEAAQLLHEAKAHLGSALYDLAPDTVPIVETGKIVYVVGVELSPSRLRSTYRQFSQLYVFVPYGAYSEDWREQVFSFHGDSSTVVVLDQGEGVVELIRKHCDLVGA